jgi:hypothetical protein
MSLKEPTHLAWDDRLAEADKKRIEDLNASLDRLSGMRAVEINVSGKFLRSKIAWKLATYQHALLHRLIALMDGSAVAWNNRCTLSAMLSARALMETFAVMAEFERQVGRLLKEENLGGLDALAQNGIFASRDPEWIKDNPETHALSVLTYIEKFDKRAEGFRGHYDMLSERCHPNSLGHNFILEARPERRHGPLLRRARTGPQRPDDSRGAFAAATRALMHDNSPGPLECPQRPHGKAGPDRD